MLAAIPDPRASTGAATLSRASW